MAAITHFPVPRLRVGTRFAGAICGTEDHRNWSGAPFQTCSRPIGLPCPYALLPEPPVKQSLTLAIADRGARGDAVSALAVPPIGGQVMPELAPPLDHLADAKAALLWPGALAALGPGWVLLRLDATQPGGDLNAVATVLTLTGALLDKLVILSSTGDTVADAAIAAVAARLAASAPMPRSTSKAFNPGRPARRTRQSLPSRPACRAISPGPTAIAARRRSIPRATAIAPIRRSGRACALRQRWWCMPPMMLRLWKRLGHCRITTLRPRLCPTGIRCLSGPWAVARG